MEFVKLLAAASKPLVEFRGLVAVAMKSGSAEVVEMLVGEEPEVLDGTDLSQCLATAIERERGDLACFFLAIVDQSELLGIVPDRSANSRWVARFEFEKKQAEVLAAKCLACRLLDQADKGEEQCHIEKLIKNLSMRPRREPRPRCRRFLRKEQTLCATARKRFNWRRIMGIWSV